MDKKSELSSLIHFDYHFTFFLDFFFNSVSILIDFLPFEAPKFEVVLFIDELGGETIKKHPSDKDKLLFFLPC
jgi:hypothetical protein